MRVSFLFRSCALRGCAIGLALLALAACAAFHGHSRAHSHSHSHIIKTEKTPPSAYAFVTDLSLAKLLLSNNAAMESPELVSRLSALQTYTGAKRNPNATQPVIVLFYKLEGQPALQQLVVPFAMPVETAPFTALKQVMNILRSMPYTLHDIRPGAVAVGSGEPFAFDTAAADEAQQSIDTRIRQMVEGMQPLTPLAQAQVHLRLAHFFMERHNRDAAYLSVENAKHALAAAEEKKSENAQTVQSLMHELETLERKLHATMPFTL